MSKIGTGFGHIAINVADVSQAVEVAKQLDVEVIRDAGPMNAGETMVAFLKDPDGYEIELLSKKF
jgi:lactoylglutathione lyase